jgi:hypothetical protein
MAAAGAAVEDSRPCPSTAGVHGGGQRPEQRLETLDCVSSAAGFDGSSCSGWKHNQRLSRVAQSRNGKLTCRGQRRREATDVAACRECARLCIERITCGSQKRRNARGGDRRRGFAGRVHDKTHMHLFPLTFPLTPSVGNILWLSSDEGPGRSVFADPGVGRNRLTGARGAFKYPCAFFLRAEGPAWRLAERSRRTVRS